MNAPNRGEVWLVDLGYQGKTRPALVLSVPYLDDERALVTLVLHTTTLWHSHYEVAIPKLFLKPGAFDAQNIVTSSNAKMLKRLGVLSADEFMRVEIAVRLWLGL